MSANTAPSTTDTPPFRYTSCAGAGHRAAVAGLVGRERHVRDPQPVRTAGRPRAGGRSRREAVRARHVPVSVGHRAARRPSAGVHRHRRVRPFQADDRSQRAAHDGVRCVRSAGRAVRRRDRPASADHHRAEHRRPTAAAAPARARPRPAPQRVDHRPALLPLDAVDLQPDLQRLARPRGSTGRVRSPN